MFDLNLFGNHIVGFLMSRLKSYACQSDVHYGNYWQRTQLETAFSYVIIIH